MSVLNQYLETDTLVWINYLNCPSFQKENCELHLQSRTSFMLRIRTFIETLFEERRKKIYVTISVTVQSHLQMVLHILHIEKVRCP